MDSKDEDHALSKKLVEEWLSLDPAQRGAVVGALTAKSSGSWGAPSYEPISRDGNIVGLRATKGEWDLSSNNTYIVVEEINNGIVAEAHGHYDPTNIEIDYAEQKKSEGK